MDDESLRSRLDELVILMEGVTTPPKGAGRNWDMSDDDVARFEEWYAEARRLRDQLKERNARRTKVMASSSTVRGDDPGFNVNTRTGGDPFGEIRVDESTADLRSRVESGLERDSVTPDAERAAALRTIDRVQANEIGRREVALRCLATGSDAYRSAFAKLATGQMATWSESERMAVTRAQSLTDAAGGYAIPFTLDPTIVLTNNGALDPIRDLARKVQITTNSWNGVTSAGTTASWDAEAEEVSDDSITLAQPSIPVYKGQVFVPFSVEIQGDWMGLESDLRMTMTDAKDRLEATMHLTGTGSGQGTGIITELDGGSSEIAPGTAETFAIGDVYNLQRQLPARHRAGGPVWVGNIGTLNAIRQFDTSGGGNMWTQLGNGTPERLLGWSVREHSEMDDAPDINAAATADNFILLVGDWKKYVIVDRVGMNVELVPHLFATANNRPSGQRGLIAWWRTGAESIDDNAFRLLSIPTAA